MNNNDILRSLRFTLDVKEAKLAAMAKLAGLDVSPDALTAAMKRDDEPGYEPCSDRLLAHLLNGMVLKKRGVDPSRPALAVETKITNNVVCKKLRTAFQLQDTAVIALLAKAGLTVSKAEVGAIFRAPGHRNYRPCGDQFLRYLIKGLAATPPPHAAPAGAAAPLAVNKAAAPAQTAPRPTAGPRHNPGPRRTKPRPPSRAPAS